MKIVTMVKKYLGMSMMTVIIGAMLGVACGDDGSGDEAGGSCNAKTQGFTECAGGLVTCQPGQYCEVACSSGCLSDVNCACNQVCDKPEGQNVGACVQAAPEPTTTGTPMTTTMPMTSGEPTTGGSLEDACKGDCDAIEVFQCFMPGELQTCFDRCVGVTEAQLTQFENCIANSLADCPKLIACQDNLPAA